MLELKEFSKKICLGTAQFSNKPYSVKNKSKILSTKGVGNIIQFAKSKKNIFFRLLRKLYWKYRKNFKNKKL